jgi:hypothetical protein
MYRTHNQNKEKQMLTIRKSQLSIPLLAMTAVVLAPAAARAATAGDISIPQVLNTSPLWADSQSYQSCNVVNVSTGSVNISIELIESSGAVLATSGSTPISLAAGTSIEISAGASYVGFARCRFTFNQAPGIIRANLTVFHPLSGGVYQTYATSEAR